MDFGRHRGQRDRRGGTRDLGVRCSVDLGLFSELVPRAVLLLDEIGEVIAIVRRSNLTLGVF